MLTNRHHLWYPAKHFRSGVSKKFRELNCNVVVLDVEIHRALHAHGYAPDKPSVVEMRKIIKKHNDGLCRCYPLVTAY